MLKADDDRLTKRQPLVGKNHSPTFRLPAERSIRGIRHEPVSCTANRIAAILGRKKIRWPYVSGPFPQLEKILIAAGNPIETWLYIQDHGPERGTIAKNHVRGNKRPRSAKVSAAWLGRVFPLLSCVMLATAVSSTGGPKEPKRIRNDRPNE